MAWKTWVSSRLDGSPCFWNRTCPAAWPARLESGQVDAALVPVVEVFRGRAASLVPGVAIACRGPVASVQMFHTGAVAGLKRVRVDRGSRSSVALLRILLREVHGIEPEFLEVETRGPDLAGRGRG